MDQEITTRFELVERRLGLMRELAGSLEQVQGAVLRSDLAAMEGHTARQRTICEALRELESEAARHPPGSAMSGEPRNQNAGMQLPGDAVSLLVRERWTAFAQELARVESRVSHLNQVYGALLRRAQRTVQIFNRALTSSAVTYAPPKPEVAVVQSMFQEVSHV